MTANLLGALTALIRLIDSGAHSGDIKRGVIMERARAVAARASRAFREEPPWTPFQPAAIPELRPEQMAAFRAVATDLTDAEFEEQVRLARAPCFVNSRYQVHVREIGDGAVHLSIKRIDQMPVHDWRDLQRIKDELIGPDCEMVELYPARSRLVDTSNQYHLWGTRDLTFRFPLGFDDGMTLDADVGGAAQRPRDATDP